MLRYQGHQVTHLILQFLAQMALPEGAADKVAANLISRHCQTSELAVRHHTRSEGFLFLQG